MRARKMGALALAGIIATTGFALPTVINAPSAKAMVCGYSQEQRTYPSAIQINVLGMLISPFGGTRMVSVYGHCGKTKVRIQTESVNGGRYLCVGPGETFIGYVNQGDKVNYAYYVGLC